MENQTCKDPKTLATAKDGAEYIKCQLGNYIDNKINDINISTKMSTSEKNKAKSPLSLVKMKLNIYTTHVK
jgi:hypothetical protein